MSRTCKGNTFLTPKFEVTQITYSPQQCLINLWDQESSPRASPLIHLAHAGTYLHPYGLEERRVSEGKFHHLFDLSQLLPAATNVIVAHFIQWLLLILSGRKHFKHLRENNSSTNPPSLQNPGVQVFAHSHLFALEILTFKSSWCLLQLFLSSVFPDIQREPPACV